MYFFHKRLFIMWLGPISWQTDNLFLLFSSASIRKMVLPPNSHLTRVFFLFLAAQVVTKYPIFAQLATALLFFFLPCFCFFSPTEHHQRCVCLLIRRVHSSFRFIRPIYYALAMMRDAKDVRLEDELMQWMSLRVSAYVLWCYLRV